MMRFAFFVTVLITFSQTTFADSSMLVGKCQQQKGDQWIEVFVSQGTRDRDLFLLIVKHDVDTDDQKIVTIERVNDVLTNHNGARGYLSNNISLTIGQKYGRLFGSLQSPAFGIAQDNLVCN